MCPSFVNYYFLWNSLPWYICMHFPTQLILTHCNCDYRNINHCNRSKLNHGLKGLGNFQTHLKTKRVNGLSSKTTLRIITEATWSHHLQLRKLQSTKAIIGFCLDMCWRSSIIGTDLKKKIKLCHDWYIIPQLSS